MPLLVKSAQFFLKEPSAVTTPNFSSSAASLKQWCLPPSLWRNPFISTKTHTLNGEPIIYAWSGHRVQISLLRQSWSSQTYVFIVLKILHWNIHLVPFIMACLCVCGLWDSVSLWCPSPYPRGLATPQRCSRVWTPLSFYHVKLNHQCFASFPSMKGLPSHP